ncbi:MAG: hypothetical protein H0X30_14365 [Anaerolineae bacterium]|nr:hypothetical protein [Anaerolineae bacterium]
MFYKSRPHFLPINRNNLIAISPIIFLLLLILWTLVNIGLTPVKAATPLAAPFAVVKRASANIRRGPGMQYGIFGTVRKGAVLPIFGQYINTFGEHWYKTYLRAFGDAWVSGMVVEISPANANIPTVGLDSTSAEGTSIPATAEPQVNNSSSSSNSNSGGNNPPPSQPTSAPPQTTPEVSG